MARACESAIAAGTHLIVQAGTGTGKSLAYLVPIILSGRRSVVATATKQLQSQLANHDLPQLAATIDRPVTWSVLKGRGNYLCLQRLDELLDRPELDLGSRGALVPRSTIAALAAWAEVDQRGDRDDVPVDITDGQWSQLSVGPQECPGVGRCPRGDDCFAEAARRRSAAADVCIVNCHLLGLDLATGGAILGAPEIVVIDEAHEWEDIASATASREVSASRLRQAARVVRDVVADDDLDRRFDRAAAALDRALDPLRASRITSLPVGLREALDDTDSVIGDAHDIVESLGSSSVGSTSVDRDGAEPDSSTATRLARAATVLGALSKDLSSVVADLESTPPTTASDARSGHVVYVDAGRDAARLVDAPLDVGSWLTETLWEPRASLEVASDTDAATSPPTVIMSSATIPAGLGSRLGLTQDSFHVIDVGTPFDFAEQALLYCAAHLPDPRSPNHRAAALAELTELVTAAGGRTLALCTSYRSLDETADHLAAHTDLEVLRQGSDAKNRLVERFRSEEATVLVATMGFWQGLDVPGRALTMVAIDRLPFGRPDDPLYQARRDEAGPDGFRRIDLPRAATRLAQGVGRLIRRESDRGVVAVLDPRLATAKAYRWDLISALPPMRRTRSPAEATAYLRALQDRPDANVSDVLGPAATSEPQ